MLDYDDAVDYFIGFYEGELCEAIEAEDYFTPECLWHDLCNRLHEEEAAPHDDIEEWEAPSFYFIKTHIFG